LNGPGSTRARSCPTDGFSAIKSVFDIGGRVAGRQSAASARLTSVLLGRTQVILDIDIRDPLIFERL
jgi:hypothetical protein